MGVSTPVRLLLATALFFLTATSAPHAAQVTGASPISR